MDVARFQPIPDPFDPALIDDLCALFAHEWWSAGRTRDEVEQIVAGTQVSVGSIDTDTGRLVSFARVLTDYVTFAVVLDVIVRSDLRSHGLGARLMDDIFTHPRLQGLRGIGLQCEDDLKPFYARWGFTDAVGRTSQMKRVFDRDAGERPADAAVRSTVA